MKIAVIGSGAIGSLVAGYLELKGQKVSLAGREDSVKAVKEKGLKISGIRGDFRLSLDILSKLDSSPDLAILAVKTQDISAALADNLEFLRDCLVLTTENGVQAEQIVARYISKEKIISSIVMFGSTYLNPAQIVHNFEGSWIIGKAFGGSGEQIIKVNEVLEKIFPVIISEDIRGMKYLKIFVNANNCIPAILGVSMQEAFNSQDISRISIAIWKEGLEIVSRAGVNLVSLPDFPLERVIKLTALPEAEAAKIFSGIMLNLSKEPLYGSILQSIKRGRASEIDYINGEFVNLAKMNNLAAPLNEKLVELVHEVEATKGFFSKEELIQETREIIKFQ